MRRILVRKGEKKDGNDVRIVVDTDRKDTVNTLTTTKSLLMLLQ